MYLRVCTQRGWKTMRDRRTHSETRKRARERGGGGGGFFFKFYFLSSCTRGGGDVPSGIAAPFVVLLLHVPRRTTLKVDFTRRVRTGRVVLFSYSRSPGANNNCGRDDTSTRTPGERRNTTDARGPDNTPGACVNGKKMGEWTRRQNGKRGAGDEHADSGRPRKRSVRSERASSPHLVRPRLSDGSSGLETSGHPALDHVSRRVCVCVTTFEPSARRRVPGGAQAPSPIGLWLIPFRPTGPAFGTFVQDLTFSRASRLKLKNIL